MLNKNLSLMKAPGKKSRRKLKVFLKKYPLSFHQFLVQFNYTMKNNILLINNDLTRIDYLENLLNQEFIIDKSHEYSSVINQVINKKYDAIIIDTHPLKTDGIELVTQIKAITPPVNSSLFMISSDDSCTNKISCLSLRIKDFLTYQQSPEELLLRIKNHLNKKITSSYADISINPITMQVDLKDQRLELTLIEFKILSLLIANKEQTLSRKKIIDYVWNGDHVQEKTLNTHLTNLRSKIVESSAKITSVKGEGVVISMNTKKD